MDLILHPLKSELNWPIGRKEPLDFTRSRLGTGLRWQVVVGLGGRDDGGGGKWQVAVQVAVIVVMVCVCVCVFVCVSSSSRVYVVLDVSIPTHTTC